MSDLSIPPPDTQLDTETVRRRWEVDADGTMPLESGVVDGYDAVADLDVVLDEVDRLRAELAQQATAHQDELDDIAGNTGAF